jgi:hypothetical protein
MNEEKNCGNVIGPFEIGRNHRSGIAPSGESIEETFSECRIQGRSSGRAGGISHQRVNRGFRVSDVYFTTGHD